MSTTIYDTFDLKNLQIISPAFTNCVDLASPPNANFQGSYSDAAFTLPIGSPNASGQTSGQVVYAYDFDHLHTLNPIPSKAKILRVIVRMQGGKVTATSDISVTFPVGVANQGIVNTNCGGIVNPLPFPVNIAWATPNIINLSDSDSSGAAGNGLKTSSSSINSGAGQIIGYTFDFTTNPGGAFPLLYMTYEEFITNFTNMIFTYGIVNGTVTANWQTFPGPTLPATGTASASATLFATNFEMEVEWEETVSWTLSPTTLVLPDNTITLSHPTGGDPIDKVTIGTFEIGPNDPWVEVWTDRVIKLHFPPLHGTSFEVIIATEFSGTVSLGTLTVTVIDLSGIYKFDINQHYDKVYERTGTPMTKNVAITPPFFVTAFEGDNEIDIMHYNATRIRITGSGTLRQVLQSQDYIKTKELPNFALLNGNNKNPLTITNFASQAASLRIYMNEINNFMNVSRIIIFYKPLYTGYPQ